MRFFDKTKHNTQCTCAHTHALHCPRVTHPALVALSLGVAREGGELVAPARALDCVLCARGTRVRNLQSAPGVVEPQKGDDERVSNDTHR